MADYEFIKYETDGNGITTITLNRPPVNAFNRAMSRDLVFALDRFAHAQDERALLLTGAGRWFSTGEDLKNICLDASDSEIREYTQKALRDYHNIIRAILHTGKPVIAALNGVAAGAGMSLALACDYRLTECLSLYSNNDTVFVPAFADMGLIPDSGMVETLPRLAGRKAAQKLCEERGIKICTADALRLNLLEIGSPMERAKSLASGSQLAFALSKQVRNSALLHELNTLVFPWEIRAQTKCLQGDYFKEKARAFLNPKMQKEAREAISHGRKA
jgi:2-(1,2-epoxy-1,2-dihydrophenyl)acetyl-CoA isomerase